MKSPMVTSAHGPHEVLHVQAGSAGKMLGSQLVPSLSQVSVRCVQTPAEVEHTPSPCGTQVPSHTPSPAPSEVSQSVFTAQDAPTVPDVQKAQSPSPLRTSHVLPSSRPPEQMPESQSPSAGHLGPVGIWEPAEAKLAAHAPVTR